ncbi:MAG: hypothetical protein H5U16_02385 [Roseovarius sp.]|nr:hypothetical protein [Roseovarius sp.]
MRAGDDLRALVALTAAKRDRETAQLREIQAEEARLRAALARLDAQAAEARVLPEAAIAGLREIGADLSWQGWVARQRAALNAELSLVLARREKALPPLRLAFGKAEAAEMLAARQLGLVRVRTTEREARALEELGLMARARDQTS